MLFGGSAPACLSQNPHPAPPCRVSHLHGQSNYLQSWAIGVKKDEKRSSIVIRKVFFFTSLWDAGHFVCSSVSDMHPLSQKKKKKVVSGLQVSWFNKKTKDKADVVFN